MNPNFVDVWLQHQKTKATVQVAQPDNIASTPYQSNSMHSQPQNSQQSTAQVQPQFRFCRKCGQKMSISAWKCPACGTVISNKAKSQFPYFEGALKDGIDALKEFGVRSGYLSENHFDIPPELVQYSSDTCRELLNEIIDIHRRDYPQANPMDGFMIALRFCALAGVGAAAHWKQNWPNLKRDGLFLTLTNPRGLDEMDEYIYDFIGIHWGSPECKEFDEHLLVATSIVLSEVHGENQMDMSNILQDISTTAKALFYYGIAVEMERLK